MEAIDLRALIITLWPSKNNFLPGWYLAKCADTSSSVQGIGFSDTSSVASAKARSEYFERRIFRSWITSGINPFNGQAEPPPADTTGFAVHPDSKASETNSYYEFLERLVLKKLGNAEMSIAQIQTPDIFPASRFYFWCKSLEIRTFSIGLFDTAETSFVFANCRFTDQTNKLFPGFLFGSAVASDVRAGAKRAIEDALRTAPIVQINNSKKLESDVARAYRFWLSSEGVDAMKNFLTRATKGSENFKVPKFSPEHLRAFSCGDLTVTYYFDPAYETARPFTQEIPLA